LTLERYREFWATSFDRLDDVLNELKATGAAHQRAAFRKR